MTYAMRTDTFAKLFFIISVTGFVMYAILAFYTFHTAYTTVYDVQEDYQGLPYHNYRHGGELKYILIWTDPGVLLTTFEDGQKEFMKRNCPQTNCFLTTIKEYLGGEYTNFDAIIFDINVLHSWNQSKFPQKRTSRQKYVFYSTIASDTAPICAIHADNYFNWTWTFKLYSDIVAPYIEVKDFNGKVVAPNPNVLWNPLMVNTNYSDPAIIANKTKAVAWIINKEITRVPRKIFATELQNALKEFSLKMDIYGHRRACPKEDCMKAIEKDYYFYLAYEDSVEEDYVTEEVLKAYQHNTVPIVIGGADYTQFLPFGSYVNARFMSVEKLAAFINYAIKNPEIYLKYFRWKNFYTIGKTPAGYGICELCQMLNDDDKMNANSGYEHFRHWWYSGQLSARCLPRGAKDARYFVSYINSTRKHVKQRYLERPLYPIVETK
ncbi:alpha-(1,3)-fucosyltransferase C-like [Plodia interpunctella]|uniref:alpha-(1,3)-fucosyltransferase C-like n=1 Tax=Plodia interpunctella TaxID=58824 RepID=UPI002368DF8E|nr:alpha-(1,3)-fucosyltransferase C-like [Plodia interpunctella]